MSFTGCNNEQAKIVKIDSDPQGAIVFIDNEESNKTPFECLLTFGPHTLTIKKEGYLEVEKGIIVKEDTNDISITLEKVSESAEYAGTGPIHFDSVPHFACCSAAAIAYSNIFYGETLTISGLTVLDSFDCVFPSGKKVHFDTEKASSSERKFSKVVAFDELGIYKIISNGEVEYSFEVCYKAKILPGTPELEEIFPDYNVKNAIAVPNGKEVTVKLLITDAKGNPIKNKPLSVYDLKTEENGIVTFKVRIAIEGCEYCYKVFVNGKPAEVRIYADILAWGYDYATFSKEGHLSDSTFHNITRDTKVSFDGSDTYMPYGSFGLYLSDLYSLSFSSRSNDILTNPKELSFIYTNKFISKDSGLTWKYFGTTFDKIAISPKQPNILYAWSAQFPETLFKSTDYGMHFEKLTSIKIDLALDYVTQILVDSADSNKIYLATWKGLLKSDDGGKKWNYIIASETGAIQCIAINPKDSNFIIAGANYGLYKSEDQGKTWEKISLVKNQPPEWNIPNCIVFDPANPGTIYAGTENTLFVSKDAGESWEKLGIFGFFGRETIAVDPTSPNKIYIYSYGKGIYKSEDYGKHFTKIDFPLNLTDVGITVNSLGELLINANGIPFKLNKNGNFVPLGGDTFLKNGPKWKIIDEQFYIAVNTIKSDWVQVIITDDTIEFYKACDMVP